jgi:hypothetical protein
VKVGTARSSITTSTAPSGHPVFTLTDVYVAVTTNLMAKLSGPEHAVWKRQLLIDLGLRQPHPVQMKPLPPGAPANAARWYDGLGRLYAARGEGWIESGVPLTASFAQKWCGLSTNQAIKGKGWLIEHGFVQLVGSHGLMKLWRPAGFDPATTASSGGGIRLGAPAQDHPAHGDGQ